MAGRQPEGQMQNHMSEEATSLTTQYFCNIQKLQNCIKSLEKGLTNLDCSQNELQNNPNMTVHKNRVLQLINGGKTELDSCITVSHCLMNMHNQLFEELIHSRQLKDDPLREKSEECQQLRLERQEVRKQLEQKENTIEQLNIKIETMNEEMVNLHEYKEDTSTKLMVMKQEMVKLQEALENSEQEKTVINSKYETQKKETQNVRLINEQLSGTLAENSVVLKQLVEDAQMQALHIRELHSARTTKEVVNEQLEEELQKCKETIVKLERDNWALVSNLTDTTRQYQTNIDRSCRLQDENILLKGRVSFLETKKEKLESDLWDTNRQLDAAEHMFQRRRRD